MVIVRSTYYKRREREERNAMIKILHQSKRYSYRRLGALFGLSADSVSKICRNKGTK